MNENERFIWCVGLLVFLSFGLWAGARIIENAKMMEVADLQAQLETERASLAEVNVELEFFKSTLKLLAEGDQLKEIK